MDFSDTLSATDFSGGYLDRHGTLELAATGNFRGKIDYVLAGDGYSDPL